MRRLTVIKMLTVKKAFNPDDENVRYKLNTEYFNNITTKPALKSPKKLNSSESDDENIRYKFNTAAAKAKPVEKVKPKPKIKVNFWSNKNKGKHISNKNDVSKEKNTRRHTIGGSVNEVTKQKAPVVKVRKRVSFLPTPIFTENHIPMVTVPDDLTIQLNEEEANDLGEDLNNAFVNNHSHSNVSSEKTKRLTETSNSSPRGAKRKHNSVDTDRSQGNENELEFFSKYVVQKLRRMETNQRIYSENLINTVLMLGQLGKLNGKSKILEA